MPEITEEELTEFNKYKEIGTPDEISEVIQSFGEVAREQQMTEAANLVGFKPSVLSRIAGDIEIEIQDGKAMVGDKELGEYAQENWEDFLPSLRVSDEQVNKRVPFVRTPSKPVKEINTVKNTVTGFLKRTYSAQKADS